MTTICRLTVGSGLNTCYVNQNIVQFVYQGNFYQGPLQCLGNGNESRNGALELCNNVTGPGGSTGTVPVLNNLNTKTSTSGHTESRYWSDYNYQKLGEHNAPAWLCADEATIDTDSEDNSGTCQWFDVYVL